MRPLTEIRQGGRAIVLEVAVSGVHGVRMAGMGILPGVRVTVLRNGKRKALLLECGRSIFAVARALALTVSVEEEA
ncbi:Fe2+ transport system protein FeoA [Humidesulfovibrio mexicanus]|jgi:Fe2+ transport system protein FeoA|uniref:Fe2+ transport system protein FeoA n=1 Tax=Humidesulfovibrio mexicanus TaxID=147047 RepID=A0A238XUD3_9BACT|nr:FeoA family protein [Humidesulfovibrio mexicanus]SNR61964.1 Fe2+ transport system protein FeoA [Humidesulfovibrio mexicanus]